MLKPEDKVGIRELGTGEGPGGGEGPYQRKGPKGPGVPEAAAQQEVEGWGCIGGGNPGCFQGLWGGSMGRLSSNAEKAEGYWVSVLTQTLLAVWSYAHYLTSLSLKFCISSGNWR